MNIFQNDANLKTLFKDAPFTTIMIFANVIVFLADFILGGWITENGLLWGPYVTVLGEYYRIISSAFIHDGIIHLLSNVLIGLYILTSGLERLIGTKKTAVVYIAGMLVASGLTLWLDYTAATVGASGAIFGALGSLLYVTIYRPDLMHEGYRRMIRQLLIFNIVFTLIMPGISITGHLGGLLGGYLISYLLIKRNNGPDSDDVWDYTH